MVKYVTGAISLGRCSLIGLLVFMSVVVVLVLLLISFPVDGVRMGGCSCPLFLCSLLLLSVLDCLRLVLLVFFFNMFRYIMSLWILHSFRRL